MIFEFDDDHALLVELLFKNVCLGEMPSSLA